MSKFVLDAVESWARPGARLLREVELIGPDVAGVTEIPGRVDGLLVPTIPWECGWRPKRGWCWDGASFAGIEVKVSRSDLGRGLSTDQFNRYLRAVGAMYLAVPRHLRGEALRLAPAAVGILVAGHGEPAICARQAKVVGVPADPRLLWKVLHLLDAERRVAEQRAESEARSACEKVGRAAGHAIDRALRALVVPS